MYQSQITTENIAISCYRILNEVKFLRKENKQLRAKLTKITRELMDILGIEEKLPEEFLAGDTLYEGSFDNE